MDIEHYSTQPTICQDGFMIIQICIVIKGGDLLELLW